MKKTAAILASLLAVGATTAAIAGPWGDGDHHERRMERLADKLDLDATQKEQVSAVFEKQREEMKEAMKQRYDSTHTELATILNADQMKEFEAMKEKRGKRWGKKDGKYCD